MFYINLKEKRFETDLKYTEIYEGKCIIKGSKASEHQIRELLNESDSLVDFSSRVDVVETAFCFIFVANDFSKAVVITDRFGSESVFYNDNEITDNIFKIRVKEIDKINVAIFFYFQRLYSDRTIFKGVKFAREARCFNFSNNELKIKRYWAPNFVKSEVGEKLLAKKLAKLIQKSSDCYLKHYEKPSILLSGGLDSRLALSAINRPGLNAVTLGPYENNEFNVAKTLSNIKQIPIEFLKRDDKTYLKELSRSVELGNGMQNIIHSHFYAIQNSHVNTDIFVHGHGFDYFFQGMYLPSDRVYFLGRSTLHNNLKKDYGDLLEYYTSKIKFKLKSIDLDGYLRDSVVNEVKVSIREMLKELADEALGLGAKDDYDIWEFINCHSLARHYTNLNLKSIEESAPQVSISWHKDIYDFFYELPHEYKMNARILKKSLMLLNLDIAKAKNANINLPAHWDHRIQSYAHFFTLFLNKIGFKKFGPPEAKERSWPHGGELLKSKEWQDALSTIIHSEEIHNLNLFNKEKIEKIRDDHMAGDKNYSDFLFSIATLSGVLSRGGAC